MSWLLTASFLACLPSAEDKPNDSAQSSDSGAPIEPIDNDGDGYNSEEDCDDTDILISPASSERCNGLDDNCDGTIDEGFDSDGDGFLVPQFCPDGDDCDDEDALVYPGAVEVPYDGRDQDCDGVDLTDVDADGYEGEDGGGDDCDDNDPAINPGVADIPKDGVDQDCDGADSIDGDGDGYDDEAFGGDDCDDDDPSISPGAVDWLNDGINSDCTGISDPFLSLANVNASIVGVTTNQEALLGQNIEVCDLDEDGLDDLVITAPFGDAYSGSAGVFYGAGWATWADNMLMESADARITGETNDFLGMGLACTDLDADGHQDLLVVSGEVEYSSFPLSKSSRIFVFYGTGGPLPATTSVSDADAIIEIDMQAQDAPIVYGPDVKAADLNGDGTNELIVLTGGSGLDVHSEGKEIHVVVGASFNGYLDFFDLPLASLSIDEPQKLNDITVDLQVDTNSGTELILNYGWWIRPDDTGDTAALDTSDTGQWDYRYRGAADVFLDPMTSWPSTTILSDVRAARLEGDSSMRAFGSSTETADFNADGVPDLVVTAMLDESSGAYDSGAIYLFSGISGQLTTDMADANSLADAYIQGSYERGHLGSSLCAIPDANGNGTDDLFVAEPGGSDGAGMLWLLDGQSLWTSTSPDSAALLGWYGNNRGDGIQVQRSTGDIDGDGITDVVVHQPGYDSGNGRVVILLSSDW